MKLYNTLTRTKEEFKTLTPKKILMYVCGITPYDTTHLGHASTYTFFDALLRYFKFKGFEVNYTQNVTDIDDDILKKAKEQNKNWKELGQFWTDKFLKDLESLNIQMPENYVKATDSIPQIIEMVKKLISKKVAYEKSGNVYFEVSKFPDFGKLSKFNQDQMKFLLKERGGNPDDPNKKAPLDFILWVKSKNSEPFWESPWGNGRPGWHIECSAMVKRFLGEQIDIHGGGRDLVFPHHESEIAQSESESGNRPYVKTWIHMAMVMYQGEKMSKSLGNLVLVSDLIKKGYTPNSIRWLLLSNHYQTPWEFEFNNLDNALEITNRLEKLVKNKDSKNDNLKNFFDFLEDDFNTQKALLHILQLSNKKNPPFQNIKFALEILGFKL